MWEKQVDKKRLAPLFHEAFNQYLIPVYLPERRRG